jgi:hypothetical protein
MLEVSNRYRLALHTERLLEDTSEFRQGGQRCSECLCSALVRAKNQPERYAGTSMDGVLGQGTCGG